jgi:hypothetical protein
MRYIMRKICLILAASLIIMASSVSAEGDYETKVDQGVNAIWVVNKDTGQVKMCRSANNNTVIICSAWSSK